MGLKNYIHKLFEDNTNYTNPTQAVNQADSLNTLSKDLYTDSKRFIYELLQNADDSSEHNKAVKVWIKTFGEHLVVAHSGRPFSPRDLQGICNVNNGTKKKDSTKTGYKGIGFKSVFGQSEYVVVYTNDEYFRFDATHPFEWTWEETKEQWTLRSEREFQFPWQIIPILTYSQEIPEPINRYLKDISANVATLIKLKNIGETTQAVKNLSQNLNMFLFLKNIAEIVFDISTPISIEIERTKQNRITLKQNGTTTASWLIKTISLTLPNQLKVTLQDERNIPDKLLNANTIELSLAAKIKKDGISKLAAEEKLLYSYLPTDETKYSLPVLVNTSFLTAANREYLHADSKWNQWLFKNIAVEIFKWISEIVKSEFQYQAYRLIPGRTKADELGHEFNKGIEEAIRTIPFVLATDNTLAKVNDTIVDFTSLSEKDFVGKGPIEKIVDPDTKNTNKKFAANTGFESDFKDLGAFYFKWESLSFLFLSESFKTSFTIANNIGLIKHLKSICDSGNVAEVTKETLRTVPFVWDHKNSLKPPIHVCFPTADDQNWNSQESDLSFLHQELQEWLSREPDVRAWLERLGMTEKTDITYITQTILPRIDTYVTLENPVEPIRELFILHKKGVLKPDLVKRLSKIKLLTQHGTLCSAQNSFLSNFYFPRLEFEGVLDADVFINEGYCTKNTDRDDWKQFFKLLGVQEGVNFLLTNEKTSVDRFIQAGWKGEYFTRHRFYQGVFSVESFAKLGILSFLHQTTNYALSIRYWRDVVNYEEPEKLSGLATAFWGYAHMSGQTAGVEVENYIRWFISNSDCIPVVTGECKKSPSVLLNTKEISSIAGEYLPVFNGPELESNWRSFFEFRTSLELTDYLTLLTAIANDIDDKGKIRTDNYKKAQSIYSRLLDQCANWDLNSKSEIDEWTKTGSLLSSKRQYVACETLYYFLDGNESIFQEQFDFIALNAENKVHPSLEHFLSYFKVTILKQTAFNLVHSEITTCVNLIGHLKMIIPFFKCWIEYESSEDVVRELLENIDTKITSLDIYQAEELKIQYSSINFIKSVNLHFDKNNLYVTSPWNTNSVLLKLPEVLCRYFELRGNDKKLDFLLRSNGGEIQKHFLQEAIPLPENFNDLFSDTERKNEEENQYIFNSFNELEKAIDQGISPEFFHLSISEVDRLKYVETLIDRAITNVINYLKTLPEYDCTNHYQIAKSIIGGIKKNGIEITVLARPSDGDKVLLFYTSEFDVLQYVDAEFWYEDGSSPPKQMTMGQLLRRTGINKIPTGQIDISDSDIEIFVTSPKSVILDFNPIPFVPQRIAMVISAFANTDGGSLIFGLKETSPLSNEVVGLSTDFRIVEITRNAISLLSPTPKVTYDWARSGDRSLFVIKVEKATNDVLFDGQKYLREGASCVLQESPAKQIVELNVSSFTRTIAIIIAIENYAPRGKNQIPKVTYATNDADKFKKMLIDKMGVAEGDIYMYVDDRALKSNLEYDFRGLFFSLTETDRLVFYYVGHGFHNGITNFLSTYDLHPSNIADTSVSLRSILLDPLKKSKCKNALIFIDACAKKFQNEFERSQISDIDDLEFKLLTNDFPYYATFLSCQTGQSSYSSEVFANGIWTYYLVNALNGDVPEATKGKKYVTDHLLQVYLADSVGKFAKNMGYDQNPRAIFDSSSENVIVNVTRE